MHHPPQGDPRSDTELISSVRLGDPSAFGALYSRHAAAVRTVAGYYTADAATADDLTSDAFERMLRMLRSGRGPDVSFRAYIYTIVRRLALEHAEGARQLHVTDDFAPFEGLEPVIDPADGGFESRMVATAFGGLPERWQAVLWYLEVERMRPAEIGVILDLSANGVSALAYRAREALRGAYLQAHVSADAERRGCASVRGLLGPWVAGSLSPRDSRRVEEHVASCDECTAIAEELRDVGHGLRAVIAPLVLGGVAAAGLLAGSGSAGTAAASASAAAKGSTATAFAAVTGAAAAVVGAVALSAIALVPIASSPLAAEPQRTVPSPSPTAIAPDPVPTPIPTGGAHPLPPSPSPVPVVSPMPPTPPPAPLLSVALDELGDLVLGRAGMVGAVVSTSAVAQNAVLLVDLPPGVTFAADRPLALGDADWTCAAADEDAMCRIDRLTPGREYPIALPVQVAETADTNTPVAVSLIADRADRAMAIGDRPVVADGMSTRFVAEGAYAVALAGSSFLDCDLALAGCAEARSVAGPPALMNNQAWQLVPRRGEGQVAASASVPVPSGARVAFAGLYWSAVVPVGASDADLAGISLSHAGGVAAPVTASTVDRGLLSGVERYQAFADVTELVAASGGGTWTALDPQIGSVTDGAHAGWSLVVVYEHATAPAQRVLVVDGFEIVSADSSTALTVPIGGRGESTVGFVAWEGDAGSDGDVMAVDGIPTPRIDALDADNVFRSRAEGADTLNTFGVDVGWLMRVSVAGPRALIDVATTGDQVGIGVLVALAPML